MEHTRRMNYVIEGMAESADFIFRNRDWIVDEGAKYIEGKGLVIESGPEFDISVIDEMWVPNLDSNHKHQVKYRMIYRVIAPRGVEI